MPRAPEEAERRVQLIELAETVAELAKHREIAAGPASRVRTDLEIRPVLATIVRRWTMMTPATYESVAAAKAREGDKLEEEHVVPVRLIVDRMIMDPTECRDLLGRAVVIALVTPAEHRALGGIWTHHEHLYGRMLKGQVSRLIKRGMERYSATGITLQPISPTLSARATPRRAPRH